MKVSFGLRSGEAMIEEAALPAWLAEHAPAEDGEQDGMLQLTPDGGEPVRLVDWIGPLMQFVCLRAPRMVLAEGQCTVPLYTVDESYTFTADGADVTVSGLRIPEMRVARAGLLAALVGCAERYVALMRPFGEGSEDWTEFLDRMAAAAATVRETLKQAERAPA